MATSLTPARKLETARLIAVQNMPYLAAGLLGLIPKETPGLGTLGVTKTGVLMWDPAVVDKRWTLEELAFILLHEVSHVLRETHARAEALGIVYGSGLTEEMASKAFLFNVAHDACINEDLREAFKADQEARQKPGTMARANAYALPTDGTFPESLNQPANLAAEERYRRLLQEVEKQQQQQGGQGQGQGGGQGGKGSPDPNKADVGHGKCGSCAGAPLPGEPQSGGGGAKPQPAGAGPQAQGQGQGQADDGDPGRSPAELERMRKQVAEAVRQAASRGRGLVPGGWERWAEATLTPPKIDWRQKLAQIVRNAVAFRPGAHDYHYSKMSRRQAGIGFGPGRPILPSLRSPVPRVAMIIDTSGSMGDDSLSAALVETRGVLDAIGADVEVCVCDAEVHGLRTVKTVEEAAALLKGGGGTDMNPAFAALLDRHDKRPEVIIVATDGCLGNGHPEHEPPGVRVVWLLLGPYRAVPCEWGEVVEIDDVEKAA